MQKLDEVVKKIPKSKDYITVPEAYALFGISKETLYRLIRKGVISNVNVGERQTRVSKEELLKLYPLRKKALTKPKPVAKLYSLEPKDCYTIGEISKKFHLDDSTVYQHINLTSSPFCTSRIYKRTAGPGINIRQNTRNTQCLLDLWDMM